MSVLGALRADAVTAGYTAAWRVTGRLPERWARGAFEQIGSVLASRNGTGVRRLRGNLRRVCPELTEAELDALTEEAMRSYMRYWTEAFRLPRWPIDDLVGRTLVVNEAALREPLARGTGVVVALPHQANWDWAGAWACATDAPLVAVAERLRPDSLFEKFVAYRESLGMSIIALTGDEEPPLPRLEKHLRDGGLVCLLADRDMSRRGQEVALCGWPARMPTGPAVLAQRTGATLLAATLRYVGDSMEIDLHGPIEVGPGKDGVVAATQEIADAFTAGLRRSPADWHMLQRVFLEAPVGSGER